MNYLVTFYLHPPKGLGQLECYTLYTDDPQRIDNLVRALKIKLNEKVCNGQYDVDSIEEIV